MKKNSEKVYVKVTSEFDSTGFMQPTSITWSDGRTFSIEQVRDYSPAGTAAFRIMLFAFNRRRIFHHIRPFRRPNQGHILNRPSESCNAGKRHTACHIPPRKRSIRIRPP